MELDQVVSVGAGVDTAGDLQEQEQHQWYQQEQACDGGEPSTLDYLNIQG